MCKDVWGLGCRVQDIFRFRVWGRFQLLGPTKSKRKLDVNSDIGSRHRAIGGQPGTLPSRRGCGLISKKPAIHSARACWFLVENRRIQNIGISGEYNPLFPTKSR